MQSSSTPHGPSQGLTRSFRNTDQRLLAGPTSSAITSALSALASLQATQKAVLVAAASGFVSALLPGLKPSGDGVRGKGLTALLAKGGWEGHDTWEEQDWAIWSRWGWWREFCRLVSRPSSSPKHRSQADFHTFTVAQVHTSSPDIHDHHRDCCLLNACDANRRERGGDGAPLGQGCLGGGARCRRSRLEPSCTVK